MPNGDVSTDRVHIYLSVFDQRDANIGFHHAIKDLEFTPEQVREIAASAPNFRYTMNVDLMAGGVYSVVVAIRDELSDETGKGMTTVDMRR